MEPHLFSIVDSDTKPSSSVKPLLKLPSSPWRSLGTFLDYSRWPERDRFLELDAAILRKRQVQEIMDDLRAA